MEIKIVKDNLEGDQAAFEVFKDEYQKQANVFGLATGSTPLGLYKKIIESDLDFSDKISINLDEYVGLDANHEQSYAYFMQKNLFNQKPFKKSYIENGTAKDLDQEIIRYENIIKNNSIDLQILGLGNNGHIAFNEPGTDFNSKTHVVDLTESTIVANSRFFTDKSQVPKQALTMGLFTIMKAKKILLIAYGQNKAEAVFNAIKKPINKNVPASILQEHENVIFILDEKAASLL
ncbi:MAG: glucosamine-6-phosphate deaminase [Lactobacillaceae bacterium]|jgi:glucosamine-6-phosphate deaminase|nr:glucosamine-6-phosphate deaminase [Lactobacillaceae bacterium]